MLKPEFQETDTEKEKQKADGPKNDNPKLGVTFFILSGFCFALNFIFAKIIYVNKPQTTPF